MTHIGQELTLGAAGGFSSLFGRAELFFQTLSGSDVLRHYKADLPAIELENVRYNLHVNQPAVLEYVPPLSMVLRVGGAVPQHRCQAWEILGRPKIQECHLQKFIARIAVVANRSVIHLQIR